MMYPIEINERTVGGKNVAQGMKGMVMVCSNRSAYVSGIRTSTGKYMKADNTVIVLDMNDRYLQIALSTDNLYCTGKLMFETVTFQAQGTWKNGLNYNKIMFRKALRFLSVKDKQMLRPNSDLCLAHKKDNC